MYNIPKLVVHYESSANRKVHSSKTYIKNLEKSYTSDLTAHLNALEQKEANSLRKSRCQEIIKLRDKVNKIETRGAIQRINETKSWFFEKINNIDKPLSKLNKRQKENVQINKIRNKEGT